MKRVTDLELIEQLESDQTPVTDPRVLSQLEAREMVGNVQLQPYGEGAMRRPGEFASGFNKGLAGVLGAPVDLMNWGLGFAGMDTQQPVGGSDWMREQLAQGRMIGTPTDRTGRVLERVGQEIGATAVPLGGMLGVASRTTAPIARNTSTLRNVGSTMMSAARQAPGGVAAADIGLATTSGMGAAAAREMYPGNPTAELYGQMAGGFGPALATGGVRSLVRGGEAGRQHLVHNLESFNRAGVNPTVGQATGRTANQALENIIAKTPGGISRMAAKARASSEQMGRNIANLADNLARNTDVEQAGRTLERGIESFAKRFQTKANSLYSIVDNFIEPTAKVEVTNTARALKQLNAPIEGAENLSGILANPKIGRMGEAFADDAAEGVLPYQAIKDLRSQVGRMLSSSELVSDAPKADLKQIYAALSQDMEAAARRAGPKAMNAFTRANNYYKSGLERIEGTLQRIANRATPEDVYKAATRGKEGASTIRKVRRSLKPEEWDVVASTMLKQLGKARAGSQNAAGDAFSPETFLTNWNNLAPEARGAIFGGTRYKQMARDLDAIAETASHIREASRVMSNPSGTAGQALSQFIQGGSVVGAMTGNWEIPIAFAALATVNNGAARLMTNPRFVRWLAGATKMQGERLPGHVARLSQELKYEDAETQQAAQEYLNTISELAE